MTTTDNFTTAARAEAEALVDDIIRWDDTIATDGPCDGTWDSLAEYLAGRGWARAHLAAEVRKAKAEAWDEATRIALNFAYLNQEDRITLYLRPPHDRNPYRETGDSDEHR